MDIVDSANGTNQSLAEATVPPGGETIGPLSPLCCCAPPSTDEDTVLLDG
jgi:hypothetical protein